MDYQLILLVAGMALVTYLPRLLPLALLHNLKLSPFLIRFMKFIPYAALASLIFPGMINSTGEFPQAAIAGAIISLILAYYEFNLLLVVIGGVVGALLMILLLS